MSFDIHPTDLYLLYDELYLIQKASTPELPAVEPIIVQAPPSAEAYLVLGKLEAKTLVFVDEENFSNQHSMFSLLQKILAAVKLNETDYAIFKEGKLALEIIKDANQNHAEKALYFAKEQIKDLPWYKVIAQSGKQMACFPSLTEMSESKEIKTQVWAVLQQMFLK